MNHEVTRVTLTPFVNHLCNGPNNTMAAMILRVIHRGLIAVVF